MNSLPWDLWRSFLIVADHGALSAAARASGISQPTLSRHIAQIEAAAGTRLFHRSVRGLTMTDAAHRLLPEARHMAQAADRMALTLAGRDVEPGGTVRLTASRYVAHYLLPSILTALRRRAPAIALEVVASDSTENLLRREADIALRMYRPTQADVVARHLGDLPLGVYATPDYLARRGTPRTIADLAAHDVVGYDRNDLILRAMASLGTPVTRDLFAFRSDDQVLCWEMVRAGFGIGFGQRVVGDADPALARVEAGEIGHLPVWLAAHPELRAVPRIRAVWDALADGMGALTA